MPRHFCLLARDALACPSGDVLVHRGPHDLGADGLARPLDTRVSEAVNGVEDGFAEREWDKWPRGAIADIDDETGGAYVDSFEVEARSCVVSDAAEIGIEGLCGCNCIPVNAESVDGIYDAVEVFLCCLSTGRCAWRGCWRCRCDSGSRRER